jgi:hypothetical protein
MEWVEIPRLLEKGSPYDRAGQRYLVIGTTCRYNNIHEHVVAHLAVTDSVRAALVEADRWRAEPPVDGESRSVDIYSLTDIW